MRYVGFIDLGKAGGGNPSPWPHVAMHHPNTHKTGRRRGKKRGKGASPTTGRDEAQRTTKPIRNKGKTLNASKFKEHKTGKKIRVNKCSNKPGSDHENNTKGRRKAREVRKRLPRQKGIERSGAIKQRVMKGRRQDR